MIKTISNNNLTVQIDTYGAELQSVKNSDGEEYLWSGDKSIWGRKAPVLFPICGGLKGGKYTYNGKEYELIKHGFANISEFELVADEEARAEFLLKSNEQTKKSYPFDFELRVSYEISGNTLKSRFSVKNLSEADMYFSLGAHESYSCPEGAENYAVIFDCDTSLERYDTDGGLLVDEPEIMEIPDKTINLCDSMFENDALVFKNFKSRRIWLLNKATGKKARLDFNGFDYLLIWKKPVGNYICLEPWTGLPDSVSSSGKIEEKEGITRLAAGKTYTVDHEIEYWN